MTTTTSTATSLWKQVRELGSLVRFSHTLFALPFAVLGGVLATHRPQGWDFRARDWLGILLAMVTARSAAMAFNRLADRHIDALNPRTATRHLPSGRLSTRTVAFFTVVCSGFFLASTLLFLPRNPWPAVLSVAVLLWLLAYSFTKRFTSLAHFWLGASLALAPVAAWIAVRGDIAAPPLWLGLAVLCWVAGFDIIYACQDAEFDQRNQMRSVPARLGVGPALRVAALCHAAMLGALVGLGWSVPLGMIYDVGLALVAVLLIYEHSLVRPDDLGRVNQAFFHVNVAISLGLLAIATADLVFLS